MKTIERSLILLVALTMLPGCAWFFLGAGGAAIYLLDESRTVDDNAAPSAQVYDPGRETAFTVTLDYTLLDPEGDVCSILVEYSTDGGTSYFAATMGSGGDGTAGLTASAGGTDHRFVWDWTADLGAGLHQDVLVCITPTDGEGNEGYGADSPEFTVGNTAPSVTIDPIPDAVTGIILVSFHLTDASSDLVDVEVEYSLDGVNYFFADIALGSLVDLGSSPTGSQHTLAWDSLGDGVAQDGSETNVTIRILPTDEYGSAGTAVTTAPFRIGNMKPASTVVYHNWGTYASPVEVEFLLQDTESDLCGARIEYSEDGGQTWGVATLVSASNPLTGLASTPNGTSNTFTWDFMADWVDTSSGPNNDVFLRITPYDSFNAIGIGGKIHLAVGTRIGMDIDVVSTSGTTSLPDKKPSASFDSNGTFHVVWFNNLVSPQQIWHNTVPPGSGVAGTPQAVTNTANDSWNPRIAAGPNGVIHLVWEEAVGMYDEIHYKKYDPLAGGWQADALIANLSNTPAANSMDPVLDVDAQGYVHVLWSQGVVTTVRLYYASDSSGSWSAPADVTPSSHTGNVWNLDAAFDNTGDLHVVYTDYVEIYHLAYDGSTWPSAADDLTGGSLTGAPWNPDLAIDPSGNITVVFLHLDGLKFVRYETSWSSPSVCATFSGTSNAPRAHAASDGTVHVAIAARMSGTRNAPLILRYTGGAWSAPVSVQSGEGGVLDLDLAVDSAGAPWVAWDFVKDWLNGPGDQMRCGIAANFSDQSWFDPWELDGADASSGMTRGDVATGPSYRVHAVYCQTGTGAELTYRIFRGAWGDYETVNGSTATPEKPALAVTSDETPHVLWLETVTATKRVLYADRGAGGWNAAIAISSDQGDADEPDVAVDGSDDLHAVWSRVTGADTPVYYATRPASTGVWSTPVVISQATGTCGSPCIAIDGAGGLHVAYSRHTGTPASAELWYVADTTGSWTSPNQRAGTTEAADPAIHVSGSGANLEIDLVWCADGPTSDQLVYYCLFSTGSWGSTETVTPDGMGPERYRRPSVTRYKGAPYVVGLYNGRFNAVGDLLYRGPSGWVSAWYAVLDDVTEAVAPIVTDTLGHLHVLWCDGTDQVRYQHRK